MSVHTGKEGVGDLNDIPEGVHTGMEGGSGAGAGMPIATVLDGVSSRVELDLAAESYTEAGNWHEVLLIKSTALAPTNYWSNIGNNDATLKPFHSVLVGDGAGADAGQQQATIVDDSVTVVNETASAATQHVDGRWHLIQGRDTVAAGTGTIGVQTDGAPRELLADTYTRFAVDATFPAFKTLGCIRRNVGGVPEQFATGTIGYYALITGVQLSQADMNVIWDAFDTGGGRSNLLVVTRAIQSVLGAGTLQWAGELNGNRAPPHVNDAGADPPIYVDCTFERAEYDLTRWSYFPGSAHALASDEDAQAVEAIYDTADADITYLTAFEADPVLGGVSTTRFPMGIAQDDADTGGSWTALFNDALGKLRAQAADDADAGVYLGTTTEVVFDGAPNLVQLFDSAVVSTGTVKAKVNSGLLQTLDASYVRTALGVLDLYSPAGFVRGPTPATFSPLGWVYWHISVAADLETIHAAISTAYAAAVGQKAKYAAVLQAVVDGGFEDDIIFAQAFYGGSVAQHTEEPSGTGAILTGTTLAAEGVSP